MNGKKRGASNAYSISITNTPSSANEVSLSLLPGSGVNVAVVQSKSVKRGVTKFDLKGPKKNSSMRSTLWKLQ